MTNTEKSITVQAGLFAAVALARATKDIRYYLNSVHFEVRKGRMFIVATDGHRIHVAEQVLEEEKAQGLEGLEFHLKEETVAEILKARKNFTITGDLFPSKTASERTLTISVIGTPVKLVTSPEDGNYPTWRRVCPTGTEFPKSGNLTVGLNAGYLADLGKAGKSLGMKDQDNWWHISEWQAGNFVAVPYGNRPFMAVIKGVRRDDDTPQLLGL